MNTKTTLEEILERVRIEQRKLEQEVERLLTEKREDFNYTLRRGKVVFERGVRRLQRQQRTGLWRYLRQAPIAYILSAPIIYGVIVPLIILDLSVTVFQHLCFRVYGIPRVRRKDHLVIDRHHLAYLNAIEKLNCIYCGYANGLIAYAREISARTEQFWCPIKHARRTLDAHHRFDKYFDYGDVEGWRRGLGQLRQDWDDQPPSFFSRENSRT